MLRCTSARTETNATDSVGTEIRVVEYVQMNFFSLLSVYTPPELLKLLAFLIAPSGTK